MKNKRKQKLGFTCIRLIFEQIYFVSTPPVASRVLLNGPLILMSYVRNKKNWMHNLIPCVDDTSYYSRLDT